MKRITKWAAGSAATVAIVASGTGIAFASGQNAGDPTSDDVPLTGATLTQATEAASAATHGGKVTSTEVGNEGIAYEVEVRADNGQQIEVQLDKNFNVTATEVDNDTGPDIAD